MAIYCVTYDLKSPGQNYSKVYDYLKSFTYCKYIESFWLIETNQTTDNIRDNLMTLTDANDIVFVARMQKNWSAFNYGCSDWLNAPGRSW
jgi:hypothetical protein